MIAVATLAATLASQPGAAPGAPGQLALEPWIATGLELDTNARRLPSGTLNGDANAQWKPPGDAEGGEATAADGLVRTTASLVTSLRRPGLVLRTDSAAGLKLFFNAASERMLVVQSRGSLVAAGLPAELVLSAQALAKARLQRSGARSYALLRADLALERPTLSWLMVRAGVSGQGFESFDAPIFSSSSASLIGGARLLGEREQLDVLVEGGARAFPGAPRRLDDPDDPTRRLDTVTSLTAQAASARRVFLSGAWTVTRNASNARGESWTRHRVSAAVGVRLPSSVTCTAQGALQTTRYDDGVSVGQLYFLGDDDENQNVVELMLTRPLIGGLILEGRVAFMGNELAVEGARYARQTTSIGLRAEL